MLNHLQKYSQNFVYLCGVLLFFSVFIISIEVFLRKFFNFSFGGVDEISSYILGICISWSLAYVLFEKMHIRIDVFYNLVSNKVKLFLDLFSMFCTLLFISFLTYYSSLVFIRSLEKNSMANTPLGTPLWIPQGIWFLGFIFFAFVVYILFFKALMSFIKNKNNNYTNIKKEF